MGAIQTVWGWQPALYLFLGGVGAGTGLVACIMCIVEKGRLSTVIKKSFWAAAICIIVGLLLLLMELTNPLRGMIMWQSFSHVGSWMTFGAWAAFLAIVVYGLSALFMTLRDAAERKAGKPDDKRNQRIAGLMKVFAPLGIVLGVAVAAYTGILLMCADVPLWNTGLLPCLFTISAIDTGVALVEIFYLVTPVQQAAESHAFRSLEHAVVVLIPLEVLALVLFLIVAFVGGSDAASITSAESAHTLLIGQLSPWFWFIMVLCGLVIPFIIAKRGLKDRGHGSASASEETPAVSLNPYTRAIVGASLALVGGCALRFLVLAAGVHADYVASALINIL